MNNSLKLLFEKILREADKSRFIEPDYDEYKYDPGQAFVDMGRNPSNANLLFPSLDDLVKFADGDIAAKANIDWQRMLKDDGNEFLKLLNCYIDWKEKGGSRKDRKAKRTSFSDKEKYFILPIENENWLFVAPRNYEACVYMDSAECGGQSARWCIGYEKDNSYWIKYLKKGSKFVLALKKNKAPARINDNDYDDNERADAKKYMIQIATEDNEDFSIQAWRPCDDPYDKIQEDSEINALFGVKREDLENALGDYTKIVNDFDGWKVSLSELAAGKWKPSDDIEYNECDTSEIDLEVLWKLYGSFPFTITFNQCNIDNLIVMDHSGTEKLQFVFKDCEIRKAYFHPLQQSTLYPRTIFDSCTIQTAYYSDITNAAENEMYEQEDNDGYMYEEYVQMIFNDLYDNGTIEFNRTDINREEYPN